MLTVHLFDLLWNGWVVGTAERGPHEIIPPTKGGPWKVWISVDEVHHIVGKLETIRLADGFWVIAEAVGALLKL